MKPITELSSLMNNAKNIVITTHQNPDADALGSSIGLCLYLRKKGLQASIISSTPFPDFLEWMPGSNEIVIFEKEHQKCLEVLAQSDLLFCLDFNTVSRTHGLADTLRNYTGTKVLIDHHLLPDTDYFDFGVSDTHKSSTCEMVFDFIAANGDLTLIDQQMANCLYAGTMTDTGSFRFSCTTPSTHRMVAQLMECGAQIPYVHEQIFDTYEAKRLKFVGHILLNRLEILEQYETALIPVRLNDVKQYDVKNSDTEGIVNYPLSIKGIRFSTFMNEKENEVKLSFRSKGDLDISVFARKYFNGGGHANASGGKVEMSLDDTIVYFKEKLQEFFKA